MILYYINWNVTPQIFQAGPIEIRWYGLLFASGFLLCYYLIAAIFKRENISEKLLDKLALYMILGTVLGARLGHCIFYDPAYYFSDPIRILKIWEGGLASHGGGIGVLIALLIFSYKHKTNFVWLSARIAIVIPLIGGLIRIGNLMNSEIIGIQTDLPWAFIFMLLDNTPRHPTQLYEALSYFIIFGYFIFYYFRRKIKEVNNHHILGVFFVVLFGMRFLIEFIKENQEDFEAGMTINMGQILSIPFIVYGIFALIRYSPKRTN